MGLRFLQGVGVRGLAQVEFKRDPRDGRLMLMECNHRMTTAIELVRHSGIDAAFINYRGALGNAGPPIDSFKEGVRLWRPADIRAFREYRRQGELTTFRWLRSLAHPLHFPVFSVTDPLPSVAPALGRAVGRLRRPFKAH